MKIMIILETIMDIFSIKTLILIIDLGWITGLLASNVKAEKDGQQKIVV